MSFLLKILAPFRSIMSKLMFLWVRIHILPTELTTLGINPQRPVLYVLPEPGFSDSLAVEKAIDSADLPDFDSISKLGIQGLSRSLFALNKRKRIKPSSNLTHLPKTLLAAIQHIKENPAEDIQIVPVSCLWGRTPDKEKSVFKIIFSDTWARPSALIKLFKILVHGRQTYVHISKPFSLREIIGKEESSELTARKINRVLRVHFRRQKEAIIGPDLSHRRTFIYNIIQSPEVQAEIENRSKKKNSNLKKAELEAIGFANELAADYSHAAIRFLESMLSVLWQRIYNGTEINGLDRLTETARSHEIIFVPCHRSHIDYLLLSYVVFHIGLLPPHIAAGINLNLPVVGPLLRRCGAFFMRRSFSNRLYSTVFAEYINMIMNKGFPIEYFIEGGRSRSGRLLAPKSGMLAMTLKSYLKGSKKPVAIIPVYIGYEKIIESGSYVKELHGSEKKKESLGGLIRGLKRLRDSFGKVYLNFGEPIDLGEYIEIENDEPLTLESKNLSSVVNSLSLTCIEGINKAAIVNPINLLAICLLGTNKHSLDKQLLSKQLACYQQLFSHVQYSEDALITQDDPDDIIKHGEELGFINITEHSLGDIVYSDQGRSMLLTYFRNNVLHIYAIPSLIACLFIHNEKLSRNAIKTLCIQVHPFLKSELFIHWSADEIPSVIDRIIEFFLAQNMIYETSNEDIFTAVDRTSPNYLTLDLLSRCILQTIERYFIVIYTLVQSGSGTLSRKELEDKSHLAAQRLSLLHEFSSPEFSDKNLFKTFVQNLQKIAVISISEEGTYIFNETLIAVNNGAGAVLASDIQQNIIGVISGTNRTQS